eukprot:gene6313-6385_t
MWYGFPDYLPETSGAYPASKEHSMIEEIRRLIVKHCNMNVNVAALPEVADLYAAGLSSFASVQLMLALEDSFEVTFPQRLQNRKTFASIRAIEAALTEILPARLAA